MDVFAVIAECYSYGPLLLWSYINGYLICHGPYSSDCECKLISKGVGSSDFLTSVSLEKQTTD